MGVSDVFTREQPENIDPYGNYLHSTEHFDCFVKEHEIKEVNVGTVLSYLKGVKLAVSNSDLSFDLEYANERVRLMKLVLIIMSLSLAYHSIFV